MFIISRGCDSIIAGDDVFQAASNGSSPQPVHTCSYKPFWAWFKTSFTSVHQTWLAGKSIIYNIYRCVLFYMFPLKPPFIIIKILQRREAMRKTVGSGYLVDWDISN
jgi:hypothetical protein